MNTSLQHAAACAAEHLAGAASGLAHRLMEDDGKKVTPAALKRYRATLQKIEQEVAELETLINRMEAL